MYNYGFRIYNPRIARFLSVDPLAPDYPWYTPYQFAGNKPIRFIDLDGLEEYDIQQEFWSEKIYQAFLKGATMEELEEIALRAERRGFDLHPDGKAKGKSDAYRLYGTVFTVKVRPMPEGGKRFIGTRLTESGPMKFLIAGPPASNSETGNSEAPQRDYWENFWGPGGGPYFLLTGKRKLPREFETFEEARPLVSGTAAVFFGVITLGTGTGVSAAVFGGGNIFFGLDDILTNEDGDSGVEVWISDEEIKSYYRGSKTIFAFVGGVKQTINFSSGSNLAVEVMSVLNDAQATINGARSTIETYQNAQDDEGKQE